MNYSGKFGSSGLDSTSTAHVELDSLSHRGHHADAITVPDAHLLFSGNFHKSGSDLIISDDLHRVVVPNYYQGDKRPTLVSPEGAPLDPKVIEALAGHTAYAQAGNAPAAKVVGHVAAQTGSASIVRNGVTIVLNNGDAVYQSDVVQTGSNSTLGLVMIDGTTFNLTANARLMLNDLTYDATSTSNSSLFTLVQGAATFVAGQVAKSGDMKVATPVATMGIRGTAVILDISSVDGKVSISVVDQRDGQVHAVQVFNARGDLIGTVTSNGNSLTLTPTATFEVIAQESNKTVAQVAQEFNAFQQALSTYDGFKANNPNTPAPTDKRGDATPQSNTKIGGTTITPNDLYRNLTPETAPGANKTAAAATDQADKPSANVVVADTTVVKVEIKTAPEQESVILTVPKSIAPFPVTPSTVTRISSGAGDHFGPVMSADGGLVVYDPDGAIYLFDRKAGTTTTIQSPGGGFTFGSPTISGDGHFIVYQRSDGKVFLYNNNAADTANYQHISQVASGTSPAISGDGSVIVVEQGGVSLGGYDQQGHLLFTITPASAHVSGALWKPAISADGNLVGFWNSDAASAGGSGHLLTFDRTTGVVTTIASTASGAGANAASISADGQFVTYQSDTSGHSEIYLYSVATGQVVFHTANAAGGSYNPVISPDGHFIIFASDAKLTADDANSVADTYVVDVTDPNHPSFKLVSVGADGSPGNAASNLGGAISSGGKFIAFGSDASNFASGDNNGTADIFVFDPSSGRDVIIQLVGNSPSDLTASGTIAVEGVAADATVSFSDPLIFSAVLSADRKSIEWSFKEPKTDFTLNKTFKYGQDASHAFVITLVSDGNTVTIPLTVTVHNAVQNAAPAINSATLTVSEGDTVVFGPANIGISDADDSAFTFKVTGVSHGQFQVFDNGQWYNTATFTSAELAGGLVRFIHDGSEFAPTFAIQADDGEAANHRSNILAGSVNFTNVNDAPQVAATLVVAPGDTVVLGPANLNITHTDSFANFSNYPTRADLPAFSFGATFVYSVDTLASPLLDSLISVNDPDSSSFSFTVTNVTHGVFQTSADGNTWVDATTFTSADLNAGHVRFVRENSADTPTFSIQADDGSGVNHASSVIEGTVSNPVVVIFNTAPVITAASLTVSEGGTTLVTSADIAVTDPDSSSFTFTVSNVSHGAFQTTADGTNWVPATTFTTADLDASHVRFVHNGDEAAPTFSIRVDDGASNNHLGNIFAGSVTFTNVNDAPSAAPVVLATGTEDTAYTITSAALLAGVTDPDGPSPLTITNLQLVSGGGSLVDNDDGTWTYTPAHNYNGPVSFNYAAFDGSLTSSSTVSLTLAAVNDTPVVSGPVTGSATENDAPGFLNALANASDVDGDTLQVVNVPGSLPDGVSYSSILQGFILDPGNAAFQHLAVGESTTVTVNYGVSDGHVTVPVPGSVSWTIHGINEAPIVSPLSNSVTEEDDVQVIDLLAGAHDVDTTDTLSVTNFVGTAHDQNNQPVDVSAAIVVGSSTVTVDPNYFDYLGAGQSVTLVANYDVSDGHTVTHNTATLTVNGVNDAAVISGTSNGSVTEAGGVNNATAGTPTATGTLTDTDVDNPANTFTAVAAGAATANGYGTFQMTAGGAWTYTLNDNNAAVQALNVGGTLIDTFSVTTADGTAQLVTVTIHGANDAAVISGTATGSATEAGGVNNGTAGTPTATGTLTDTDVDNPANTFVAVAAGAATANGYGTFQMTAGGAWTYTLNDNNAAVQALNAGGTLTDTFSITTTDGTTQSVTVTIHGSNDAATISGTSNGSVTEAGGVNNGTAGTPTASGTLTDTDIDNPANTFTAVVAGAATTNGYGTFQMTAGGTWTYTLNDNNAAVQALNVGATLTDTFSVTTADGTAQLVTVAIHGTNDAAAIAGATSGSVVKAGGTTTATGTLTDADVDNSANTFIAVAAGAATANGYGTFQITAGGVWTFTLDGNNPAVQALSAGGQLTDTFAVQTQDGTAQVVAIAINGSNTAPTLTPFNPNLTSITEDQTTNSGQLVGAIAGSSITDPDNGAVQGIAVTGATSTHGSWQFSTDGGGTWTNFGAYSASSALLLAATDSVRFLPDGQDGGNDTFSYVAWDQISGSHGTTANVTVAGGTTAFSIASDTAHLTVTAVNDPAVIAGTTSGSVTEAGGVNNATAGTPTATGSLTDTDIDNPANTFTAVAAGAATTNGYGTFQMAAGGTWTYTLNDNNAAVQALNVGGTLTDSFTVTTADGTAQLVTVTIHGANDAAVIAGTTTGSATEAGGVNNATAGTPTATGSLTDTDIDNPANTFTAVAAGAATTNGYGTFQMAAGGTWTYTLNDNNAAVQALNVGGTLTDSFTVTTADGTAQLVTVTIHGANDAAVIAGTTTGSATEAGGVNNGTAGTPTATGTLTDTDVDNPANTFVAVAAGAATANGYGTFQMAAGGTWTYTLNDNNAAVQALNVGGTLTDSFTVTTADGAAQLVTVTIHGANDAAVVAGPATGSVTEAGGVNNAIAGTPAATGTLTDTDVDNSANTFIAVAAGATTTNGYGTFQMAAGGTWTYTLNDNNAAVQALNVGGTLTDSFTVTTSDGTAQLVTVTIHGANDTAVIAGTTSGSVTEAGVTAGTPTASGTLTDTDIDNPANTFTAVAAGAATTNGYGTFQMATGGTWTYTLNDNNAAVQALNVGGTLTDSFTVTTADGTAQLVTVTIHGANDAAVVAGTTSGSVTEAGGVNNAIAGTPAATGTLTDTDVDNPANTFIAVAAGATTTNGYGTFQMAAGGTWTYTLNDNNAAVQALNVGGTLTDSFTVTTSDGTAQLVTVTIHGANDTAVIAGTTSGSVTEAGITAGTPTATGTLTDTDIDNPANTFTAVAAGATTANGYGTFQMAAGGTWTYTLNDNNAAVQALNVGGTLTDSFTVTTADGTAQLVTVTIHGANDTAVVAGTTSGSVIEAGVTAGTPTATGALTDTDIDNPANTFTAVAAGGATTNGYGTFQMATGGTWTYTLNDNNAAVQALNVGGTLTDSFTVTTADGTAQLVTVTIHGANDAAVIAGPATGSVTEAGGVNNGTAGTSTATGTLTDTDVDNPANTFVAVAAGAATTNGYGTFQMAAGGAWTYTLNDNSAAVQALNSGGTLTDTFSVTTTDGTARLVTVTVHGANDAPIAAPVSLVSGTGNTPYTITAAMLLAGVTDLDGPSASITSVSVASGGGGIVNNGGGTWTYTPAANYTGPVSFNYAATDGSLSASSTASLTLNAPGIINGTPGPDVITGTSQADSIFGLAGNDIIKGLAGNDQIDGGTGRDFADYSDANDGTGITVDMASGTVTGGSSVGTDTLRSIENIRGTDFADVYVATGFDQTSLNNAQDIPIQQTINNTFEGGGGNDNITGSSGTQVSYSTGNGGTQISYAHAFAAVTVDLLAGTAHGTAANDVAHVGNDTFIQVSGVIGSGFDDTLLGTNSVPHGDAFFGGAGNDFIDGRIGYDSVSYYSFLDPGATTGPVSVNLAAGTVTGDASVGTDTLRSIEIVRGTQFNDTYTAVGFGLAGAANVSDMGNFNQFDGQGGDDTITGNGNTRIDYNYALAAVTVDFQLGTARSTIADDAGVGVDTIVSGVNSVRGSSFNDTLLGSDRNENFLGGRGDDLINGRNGFDRAVYNTNSDDAVTSGITVHLAAGTVQGDASVGNDTLLSIEAVQGTDFADSYDATGYGVAGAANVGNNGTFNEFEGGGGNDSIIGNGNTRIAFYNALDGVTVDLSAGTSQGAAGGDVAFVGTDTFSGVIAVAGSNFADSITGSDNAANTTEEFAGRAGNDFIDGKGGFDRAYYSDDPTAAGIQVNMASGTVTGDATIGTDTLRSIESIRGTNFADTYDATGYGIAGAANIGNNGTFNEIEGLGGNDTITGNGNTRIAFYNAFAGVTVDLAAGTSLGTAAGDTANVGTDTFTLVNAVRGSNFGDTILGDANANTLDGRAGDDRIDGRGGNDTLIGGTGADTFVYADGGGADTITDFNRAEGDKIDLSGVSSILTFADIQSKITSPAGVSPTVIDFGGGNTLTLTGVTSLQQSDFILAGIINGTSNADVLVGTSQADAIFGLEGNDRLQGLAGNDHLDGGLGFDRAIYTDATGGVTINLAAGNASGAGAGTDTLVGIEAVTGSDSADTFNAAGFTGSAGLPNPAFGQNTFISTGTNAFEGRGGDDFIIGDLNPQGQALTRVEYLSASAAVTVDISGGVGKGTAANDVANVGTDTFSNVSSIWGSAFNDTLLGSDNANFTYETYEGRGGDDFIDGRGGYDIVTYNNDPATTSGITVHLAAGTVTGDATVGTDTIRHVEAVRGTNFDDVFDATGFSDTSTNAGSSGTFNDFSGAGGNDTIIGNGNTRLNYQTAAASVSVDLETSAPGTTNSLTVAGSATGTTEGTDTFTGVNAVQGSMFNDSLLGSSFSNTFTGLGGNDFIDGRGGFDTASYNSLSTVTGGVTVNMAAGSAIGDASIGLDTLRNIEGVQGTMLADVYDATGYGLAGALNVSTSSGNFNQFEGLGGNDQITGNGNTRVIYANATAGVAITIGAGGGGSAHGTAAGDAASVGNDTFISGVNSATGSNFGDVYDASGFTPGLFNAFQGNSGNDQITGNGATQVQYTNATSGVTIALVAGGNGSATGDGSVGTDNFVSGVNSAVGGNLADSYNASAFVGFNAFQGNGGNDSIIGNGATQIQYGSATAGVTVDLTAGTASGDTSVGTDTFTGVNNVAGSNFNDTILGGATNDFLVGNGGNDILNGRGGNDNLSGGAGADTFVYADGGGADIVNDFNRAEGDKIDLTGVSGIFSFTDVQSRITSPVGVNPTVIDFGGGNTLTLNGVISLQQSDFIFPAGINGTPGQDVITGTSQADSIFGLAGDDTIKGLAGNDLIDGGTGRDVADYSDANDGAGIVVDMASGFVSGGASVGTDTLRSIEYIRGTDLADAYVAIGFNQTSPNNAQDIQIQSTINNIFEGGGGDDTIVGSSGAQASYSTGDGGTQISYAHALAAVTVDLLAGTAHGTAANDVAHVGNDTFIQVSGVAGSAYDDTLSGTNSVPHGDVFYGGAGNDFIDGRIGYDFVSYYNNFDPSLVTGPVSVNLAAGTVVGDASVGSDTLRSIEIVRGTQFNDTYTAVGFGLAGAANVSDMGNFNQFDGQAGDDTITGNGNTRIDYNYALAAVTVDFQLGTARSTIADDAGVGVDTIVSGVNSVRGSSFNDTLLGSDRNENFLGGRGDDLINGRNGFDRAVYNTNSDDAVTSGITVHLAAGTVQGDASVGNDTLLSIEAVQGTDFADSYDATGYGVAGAANVGNNGTFNEFEGGGGNDSIIGNGNTRIAFYNALDGVTVDLSAGTSQGAAGGDVAFVGTDTFSGVIAVAGSNFADSITGSDNAANTTEEFAGRAGNDFIDGKGGFDRAYYSDDPTAAGIQVNMASGTVTGDATIGTDTLRSIESIRGTNFADTYDATGYGIAGAANIGNNGTFNEIEGLGGNDTITGNGNTRIAFYNAFAGVTVDLAAGTSLGTAAGDTANVGTDTFTLVNAVRGSNFGDTILGDANANTLDGRAGDDRIDGRGGNDTLIGGTGADTFVYADGGGADTITDFNRAEGDKIDLSGVSSILTFADIQSKITSPAGVSPTVIDFGGGNTLTLTGVTSLQQSDFILAGIINGTSNADVLVGTSQADAIFGLEGNDRLQGLAGNDHLDGGLGFDRAIYTDATGGVTINLAAGNASGAGAGTDTLVGIEGVVGSSFADTFNAGGFTGDSSVPGTPIGFNEFEGGAGNDIINSAVNSLGAALTRVSYVSATSGVVVDIAAGTASGDASVGHDTFNGRGILSAWGSSSADTLSGSNNGFGTIEVFAGFGGNDAIDGRGGFDRADYNNDSTTTSGISVNLAAGMVTGDATIGIDTLVSVEAVRGTNFADTFDATGFSGSSTNAGSLGTFNEFTGNGGNDTITGNGNTRLSFNDATAGVTVDIAAGTADGDASVGHDTFTGVNAVQGSMFADTLLGSSANETFIGVGGNDTINGRGGFDIVSYSNIYLSTGGVSIDLAAGHVTGDSSIGTDTLQSIEGIQGTVLADTYTAAGYGVAGAANVGNNGTFNQFEGLGGDDTITGNANTKVIYSNATDGVTITIGAGGAGSAQGTASGDTAAVGHDTFVSGVNAALGSNFADVYDAHLFNNGFNTFQGNAGDDQITGNGATQLLYGNAASGLTVTIGAGGSGSVVGDVATVGHDSFVSGVNSVIGGNFADSFNASGFSGFNSFQGQGGDDQITGNGSTQVQYGSATSGVTITIGAGGTGSAQGTAAGDTATVGHDTFTGGVNAANGSNFDDAYDAHLFNSGVVNSFLGQGGNDTITGNGATQVQFTNATAGVTVDLVAGTADGDASVGHDTITGGVNNVLGSNFNDSILGSSANEFLNGGAGNDTLNGGAGSDTINGGGGADLLTGGAGADRFSFFATSDSTIASHDTISDFVHGSDIIDTFSISGITTIQGLISGSTQVAAHSIVWIQSGLDTIVYANSTGTAENQGSANMEIILANVTASTLVGTTDFFHV